MGYEGYTSPQERIEARNKLDREYANTRFDVLTVTWDEKAQGMREIRQSDGYYYDEGGVRYNKHHAQPIAWRDPNEWKERPDTSKLYNHPDYGPIYATYIRSIPSMNAEWQKEWSRRQGGTGSSRGHQETDAPIVDGYTLHRDVPFKEIRYPYTDEDNRYHKHRNKNSEPLDGRS